jgi:hypothetical protein
VKTVAALFVEKHGVYSFARGVDLWPVDRDARKYPGPYRVVAHPPCQRWSKMTWCRPELKPFVGKDDGCFQSALDNLERWGGVLEHPAQSMAFARYGLMRPKRGSWQLLVRGVWVTEVNQAAYGHDSTKPTWLIFKGRDKPPNLIWDKILGTHILGTRVESSSHRPRLDAPSRVHTPLPFRNLLLRLARLP